MYPLKGLLSILLRNSFFCGATVPPSPPSGPGPPHSRGFSITHNDAPQSVGLLWTSDQLVAETSTWQHTTLTTDKHPYPWWNSNPQSQQASGHRIDVFWWCSKWDSNMSSLEGILEVIWVAFLLKTQSSREGSCLIMKAVHSLQKLANCGQ